MALITCHECGHQISTQAYTCPQCGAPVKKSPAETVKREPEPLTVKPKKKQKNIFKIVGCLICLGLILFIVIIASLGTLISNFSLKQEQERKALAKAQAEEQARQFFLNNLDKHYSEIRSALREEDYKKAIAKVAEFQKYGKGDYREVKSYYAKAQEQKRIDEKRIKVEEARKRLEEERIKVEEERRRVVEEKRKVELRKQELLAKLDQLGKDHKAVVDLYNQGTVKSWMNLDYDFRTAHKIYNELVDLEPNNSVYKKMQLKLKDKVAELDSIAERKRQAEAARQREEEEKRKAVTDRKARIEAQFSAWNGSHINLVTAVKRRMNDPKSFKHVETRYGDKGDHLIVVMQFRGKNAFGGLILSEVVAKASLDCGFR